MFLFPEELGYLLTTTMQYLIKSANIVLPESQKTSSRYDILIKNGIIEAIAPQLDVEADVIIEHENLQVSPGWYDVCAHFDDPGYGNRETLVTGAEAAAAGGFTGVQLMPDTEPPLDHRSAVESIERFQGAAELFPMGMLSGDKGTLNEMYDMHQGGAIGFSNAYKGIASSSLLLKALQYLLPIHVPVIQIPGQKDLIGKGAMHEGLTSTAIGLTGIPSVAEEVTIHHDIEMVRYTGGAVHFSSVSTAKGLNMIREAKHEGLSVTCSVTAYHTVFCDEDLKDYDTNLKVFPPLRSKEDRDAIRKAIMDGTVDCIASHHRPLHLDEKVCEFEKAGFGMATIQYTYNILRTWLDDEQIIVKLLTNGRTIFQNKNIAIEKGSKANLTLFVPNGKTLVSKECSKSLSLNNPFIGQTLPGEIIGTIIDNQYFKNHLCS